MIHRIVVIVVGADGADGAQRAVRWAASQAQELDAEVIAVYAIDPIGEFVMGIPPIDPTSEVTELREAFEHQWCKPLTDAAINYGSESIEDNAVHGILTVAEREHADMIVLGAQGHGGVADRRLGGVTYKIADRAHQPVVN